MRNRLAYFGGSFDPVHRGHLHVARAVIEACELRTLFFLPAPSPPHKRGGRLTDIDTRVRLLRLAIDDDPRLEIDETEVRKGGTSYTYDTLCGLRDQHRGENLEICFVIGGDSLFDLPKWYRGEDLVQEFTLITIPRDPRQEIDALLAPARAAFGEAIAQRLRRNIVPVEPLPISSTEIRAVARAGATVEVLAKSVPERVAEVIVAERLYVTLDET